MVAIFDEDSYLTLYRVQGILLLFFGELLFKFEMTAASNTFYCVLGIYCRRTIPKNVSNAEGSLYRGVSVPSC